MSLDTEVLKVLCVCVCVCDRFKIEQFDTGISYPDDPRKEPRDKELELMKNIYQYGQTAPDLPVQVSRTSVHFGSMPCYAMHKHDLWLAVCLCHAMLCINIACDWLCVCATLCYA